MASRASGTQRSVMWAGPSVTFPVTAVEPKRSPRDEIPARQAVEDRLGVIPAEHREEVRREDPGDPRIEALLAEKPIEAASHWFGRLVWTDALHPVVGAAQLAYASHQPLVLSPDMLWLMVLQGVAAHVANHPEQLRSRLVRHQGRLTLTVRRDDFHKGSPDNDWESVLGEFSAQIRGQVGAELHDQFLPRFTTSDAVSRAAAEVVLMDALRPYFSYGLLSLCGIPSITLEGSPEDWRAVARGARGFRALGLEWWLDVLGPVLDQFVAAAERRPDPTFWRALVHVGDRCAAATSGWILAFFPYLISRETGRPEVRNPWITRRGWNPSAELEPGMAMASGGGSGVEPSEFPSGLSRVSFRWRIGRFGIFGRTYPMEFLAGFIGIRQVGDEFALRPEIGWAVRDAG